MEKAMEKERKIDGIIEKSIMIFVFFLPFFSPAAYVGLIVALIFWLRKVGFKGLLDVEPKNFGYALLGLTFAVLLSVIFSVDRLFSLGCFGLYIFYPLICLLMANSAGNSIRTEKVLKAIILSGIVVTGFGVFQLLTKFKFELHTHFIDISLSRQGDIASTWGNPNRFAKYLDIVLPLSFVYFLTQENTRERLLSAILIGLGLICLPFTKCLGGIAAILAGLIVFLTVKNWKLCLVLLIVLSIFVLFKFNWLIGLVNRYASMGPRIYAWRNVIPSIIKDHPITGSGLGTYVKVSYKYYSGPQAAHTHAHSIYFNYLAEIGILGFGAFLLLIVIFFRRCIIFFRKYSFFAAKGVVGGCFLSIFSAMVHGTVETFVDHFQLGLLFWLVIGLGIGVMREHFLEEEFIN
ncbi:hypothetical protein DRJ00_07430 [Candidatus Aerophobetes bacterium]|uniref:O-antigen ligase-related domain-containing protein n=1 Tax=Aerophobetes bacterium TaxID=2030807 RepID=A0A497E2M5_UNCAE|nr:MAG: hypothetical protein DRJ00_07430 [Candidatus Aerophobetes bacterium]